MFVNICHIEIFAPRHTYIVNNYHILFRTKLLIIQSEMVCTKLIQRVFYDRILILKFLSCRKRKSYIFIDKYRYAIQLQLSS